MIRTAIKSLVIAALVFSQAHTSLFAQAPESDDPYTALALAFASEEIAILRFEQDMNVNALPTLKQIPELAQLERDCPGYFSGYLKVMRPIIFQGHMEDNAIYQEKLVALFRARLSEDQAAQAADIYGSQLGQNLLAQAILNMSAENILAEIVEGAGEDVTISAEAYSADKRESVARLLRSVSPEEMAQLEARMRGTDWLPAFMAILPEAQTINLEILNSGYSAPIEAKLDAVAQSFTASHVAACEAG